MPGRATCANCATASSAPRCWRRGMCSRRPTWRCPWWCRAWRRRVRPRHRSRTGSRSLPPWNATAACLPRPRRTWACRGRRCTGAWSAMASRAVAATEMRWRQRIPLSLQFTALALVHLLAAAALAVVLAQWLRPAWAALLAVGLFAPLLVYQVRRAFAPMNALFRALAGSVASYHDGDFSFGLAWEGRDELGELGASHNALGMALREQRVALVQRELLLDTMVQNTPVAMILVDPAGRDFHADIAARELLGEGHRLEGRLFEGLLATPPDAVREAFARGGDGMFSIGQDDSGEGGEEIYHLSRRGFRLNGRRHELVMLRQLTAELRRQEVQTWKKVIRVISHELNNSLARIASLAHSGAELLRRGQHERLPTALATIEERARHLEGFIR